VVVAVGVTLTDPPETGDTFPTPLLIDALVELELVQVSVAELPDAIEVGLAENDPVGVGTTVTVAWNVDVPPGPVSVRV
jgi:hypothetical protein